MIDEVMLRNGFTKKEKEYQIIIHKIDYSESLLEVTVEKIRDAYEIQSRIFMAKKVNILYLSNFDMKIFCEINQLEEAIKRLIERNKAVLSLFQLDEWKAI